LSLENITYLKGINLTSVDVLKMTQNSKQLPALRLPYNNP